MNSAGRSNISSIFEHGLQDGYLSLNPHVKSGLFPLIQFRSPKMVEITNYLVHYLIPHSVFFP